jgi:hypothetical protein
MLAIVRVAGIGTHFLTYIFQNRVMGVSHIELPAKIVSSHTVFDGRDLESELDALQAQWQNLI